MNDRSENGTGVIECFTREIERFLPKGTNPFNGIETGYREGVILTLIAAYIDSLISGIKNWLRNP